MSGVHIPESKEAAMGLGQHHFQQQTFKVVQAVDDVTVRHRHHHHPHHHHHHHHQQQQQQQLEQPGLLLFPMFPTPAPGKCLSEDLDVAAVLGPPEALAGKSCRPHRTKNADADDGNIGGHHATAKA